MTAATEIGQAGLKGWREKVGARVAPPVAERTPMSEEQVRALVGGAFFALSLIYVAKTIATVARQARG